MEHTVDSLTLERDGIIECIAVLMAYVEEVYKGDIPPGVKMCIDKLKDKCDLCADHLRRLSIMATSAANR
jgi:hypothetical protein